ncbi:Aste57867_10029 [Aphanomyces stellatus]|uniref:Aste57867_10029 protein n=1 Tax=Aphanomyces stellatus TaxID=120398 RepID=A0A485KPZ4_9STRA|nr:hypothetical protein As57867_009990 [Aphanomyces stellatus]VFT86906.1 Aste57867_10029 [Aphanomyces stellatus]
MRSALQNNIQLIQSIWTTTLPTLDKPLPLQVLFVTSTLLCMGFHYELVLSLSIKDRIRTRIMQVDANGHPSPTDTHQKFAWVGYAVGALQMVPTCVVLFWGAFPGPMCTLASLGAVLASAVEDLKNHIDDVEVSKPSCKESVATEAVAGA